MNKETLVSVATVSAGQSAPKQHEFSDEGIPFVRAGSLEGLLAGKSESELELVPQQTASRLRLKLYPRGSILFAKSGMSATKGRIYALKNPAYVVSHLAILIPNEKVHGEYLRLALNKYPPSTLIKDPAYPAIGLGEIENYKIPVPAKLDDQKRIAYLLSKVERLIAQRKQHLQQLDDLVKSVFLEMFGDPVRNERGWEKAPIAHFIKQGVVLEVQDGNHGNDHPKVADFSDAGLPFVTANVVRDGKILFDKCYYLSTDWLEKLRIGFARPGDVLLSHKGTLGLTAILDDKFETYIFSPQTTYYRVNSGKLLPEYLQAYFNSDYFQWLLKKEGGTQATRAYIGITKQKNLPLMLPPIEYQIQFFAVVEKVEGIKSCYQQNLADLETLYGALSQKAFKGELDLSRVPPSDEAAPKVYEVKLTDTVTVSDQIKINEYPMSDPQARKNLLRSLFEAYLKEFEGRPLSLEDFWQKASWKTVDLMDELDKQWNADDYDQIKAWLFECIRDGRLEQTFVDEANKIQLKVKA